MAQGVHCALTINFARRLQHCRSGSSCTCIDSSCGGEATPRSCGLPSPEGAEGLQTARPSPPSPPPVSRLSCSGDLPEPAPVPALSEPSPCLQLHLCAEVPHQKASTVTPWDDRPAQCPVCEQLSSWKDCTVCSPNSCTIRSRQAMRPSQLRLPTALTQHMQTGRATCCLRHSTDFETSHCSRSEAVLDALTYVTKVR